jgi:serine/threonine protein phosphatase PrpC
VCRQRRGLAGRFRTDPDTIACSAAGLAALRTQVPATTGAGERQEVLLVGCRVLFAHVGDSRLYRCRGGRCRQLTVDHTVAAEIAVEPLTVTDGGEAMKRAN